MSNVLLKNQQLDVKKEDVGAAKEKKTPVSAKESFIKGEPEKESVEEIAKEKPEEEKLPTETKAKIVSKPSEEVKSEVSKSPPKEEAPSEKDRIQEEFSRRFAALSKREKFISSKEKEGRDKFKRLEELEKLESSIKENPYQAVEKYGGTYEDWTNRILKGDEYDQTKEIKKVREELESWKEKETREKSEQEEQRRLKTYNDELGNINSHISKNSDKFPRVNLFGDEQLIFDIRSTRYQQDVEQYGQQFAQENLLSIDVAAQMAEDWRKEYMSSKNQDILQHFQKTFGEPVKAPAQEEKAALAAEEEKLPDKTSKPREALPERTRKLLGMRTLTNKQQTTVPAKEDKQAFKSDQERIEHAASFLKWT